MTAEQVMTELKQQPLAIATLTAGLPRARLHNRPTRGSWSVNDVLAHLRSCADVWGNFMAIIVNEDRPTIRAIDPRTWIKKTNYPELEFVPSFRAFGKQRAQLLAFLRPLPVSAWSRSAIVTGGGRARERTVLEYGRALATHEHVHLKQLARIVDE
jgi:hypothetical protein